ncbi:hypothetical protein [Rhodococcus daqingensis]|uniref:Uncharacterized protein n=1 Tax=Rhodococcus daqingensis TaxID=2479363 RepID=A0ABW2S444_9NOCA
MPAAPQALVYTADEARDTLRGLLTDSGVVPSKDLKAAMEKLDTITAAYETARAELDNALKENDNLTEDIADAIVSGDLSVSAAVTKVRQSAPSRDERRLYNKLAFRYDQQADRVLRKLGNTIVADILAPWAESIVLDLVTPAAHVVEHGHRTIFDGPADPDIYDKADRLVVELHAVYAHANTLRGRGILTPLADGIDPRLLAFTAPHRLGDLDKSHRQTWWMSYAITNGAGPAIRTSYEAEAAAKVPAA